MNQAPTTSALDEETARAELYGLLAALYYAAPGADLAAQLRVAVTEAPSEGGSLQEPWSALVAAARAADDAALRSEYNALFGGVGKPEVYLFGSHFLSGFLNEKPLAALRGELARLGLERDPAMPESEDHFACLCEVMRYLIASDDVAVANLTQQRAFFSAHIQPWVLDMCDDIGKHPRARFYAALAGFTRAFMGVEAQGFDMLD
ncbi:MAG: molecular chaperone TorD family protein [Betaproteobacteria bacterium]